MTWLYIPASPSASAPDTAESTSVFVSRWARSAARYCTANGKRFPPRYWSRKWKADAWLRLLFGQICTASRQRKLLDGWASGLRTSFCTAESPASRGRTPASGKAATMSGGCGLPSGVSHRMAAWDGYSWKTCGGLFQATIPALTAFFATSLSRGGMRNGICFPRPNAARRMSVNGFSSSPMRRASENSMWATPGVAGGGKIIPEDAIWSGKAAYSPAGKKIQIGLDAQVMWATPTARPSGAKSLPADAAIFGRTARRKDGTQITKTLQMQVMNWPTPAARDCKGANGAEHFGKARPHLDQLPNAVLFTGLRDPERNNSSGNPRESWYTPKAGDTTGGGRPRCGRMTALKEQLRQEGARKLNPDWVEMLMGVPPSWTNVLAACGREEYLRWETASCRLLRDLLS